MEKKTIASIVLVLVALYFALDIYYQPEGSTPFFSFGIVMVLLLLAGIISKIKD